MVYFRITDKCNLNCGHCAYGCGPGEKSMLFKDVRRVIDNICYDTRHLIISGGEVTADWPLLEKTLTYIKEETDIAEKSRIEVETNGRWVRDEESAYRTLKRFYGLGVEAVSFTGFDDYHREQGLDTSRLEWKPGTIVYEALERLRKEEGASDYKELGFVLGSNDSGQTPLPVGRSKNLPKKSLGKRNICGLEEYMRKYSMKRVMISPDGNVNFCCLRVTPDIGNAIEESITDIIESAWQDKDGLGGYRLRRSPYEEARRRGIELSKDAKKNGECLACIELFDKLKVQTP